MSQLMSSPPVAQPARPGAHETSVLQPSLAEEVPRLASGVRLLGALAADGFAQQQWLIERDRSFIQVSELLYRVAERIDGYRSLEQIAVAVTTDTKWALEAEHVKYLIDHKLEPLGVIERLDTTAVAARVPDGFASPFQLAMRFNMLSPRIIERLTAVLQHLFAPVMLIPVCVLVAISHWWLYAEHGIQNSIEQAFYVPGGLLFVLALAVAAGLFHELGHASALRYGGGRARGIGFGLYLVYPAFYSDVTDAYRLPRAGRIRTDLGGIYFHFIFALALIGIAVATGSEFLLAAVLLFNVEALRQAIPLVRLDGYWLLADLTGVPDIFSALQPSRGGLRSPDGRRTAAPDLKPWVKRTLVIYMLITLPLLAYLVLAMLLYVPELARLTQNALEIHARIVSGTAPLWTKVLSLVQMALVPLPLVAAVYVFYRLVAAPALKRLGTHVSQPVLRLAAASALAAGIAFLAATWTPADTNAPTGAAIPTNPTAADLAERAQGALRQMNSLHTRVEGTIGGEPFTATVMLHRPNQARIDVAGSDEVGKFSVISDGTKLFVYFPESNQYTETTAAPDGQNITAFVVDIVRLFYRPERLADAAEGQRITYAGRERVADTAADVLEVTSTRRNSSAWRYWIDDAAIVRRIELRTADPERKRSERWIELADVRVDAPVDPEAFQWTPPPGARPLDLGNLGINMPTPQNR